jgi:hypothetical protein
VPIGLVSLDRRIRLDKARRKEAERSAVLHFRFHASFDATLRRIRLKRPFRTVVDAVVFVFVVVVVVGGGNDIVSVVMRCCHCYGKALVVEKATLTGFFPDHTHLRRRHTSAAEWSPATTIQAATAAAAAAAATTAVVVVAAELRRLGD